jgi:zona occludens toxin
MSAYIFHGPPGSFKSATAMWFEVVSALKQGRLVVTNVEGCYPLDEIEKALNIKFPVGAELWRLSSQSDKGLELWKNWFHWVPPTALILIDEVQGVYPVERTFKPETCDYKHISEYKGVIPDVWYNRHLDILETYKPDNLTAGDVDDLGEIMFDDYGHILYPKNLKESFMRHRKYGWDIICCTPNIKQTHSFLRDVVEYAYHHKYFKKLEFIPYFYRRPRVIEHAATANTPSYNKTESKIWRKIPLEVHKLYRSATATEAKRKTVNPFKDFKFLFVIFVLLAIVCYWSWYFLRSEPVQVVTQEVKQESIQSPQENTNTNSSNDDIKTDIDGDIFIDFPISFDSIFFAGHQNKYRNNKLVSRDYLFVVQQKENEFFVDSDYLKLLGYNLRFINECVVILIKSGIEKKIYCKPNQFLDLEPDNSTYEITAQSE